MSKAALRNAGKQFRMWMPNMPIFLVTARNRTPRYPLHAVCKFIPNCVLMLKSAAISRSHPLSRFVTLRLVSSLSTQDDKVGNQVRNSIRLC